MDRLAKTIASGKRRLRLPRSRMLNGSVLGHGDFRYRVHMNWINDSQLPVTPALDYHEMVFDAQGRLLVLSNDYRNNVIVIDMRGDVVDGFTLGLEGAHGLTIARDEGGECLFITDYKTRRVYKTTLWGQVLMIIDAPEFLDIYDSGQPYLPTGTAVSASGDIYVADGYGSSYVVQYDRDGRYMRHFGGKGKQPNNINSAHGIAIDPRGERETILVTSREEACFKRFTLDGHYLETISLPGAFMCRPVIEGENLYTAVCWSHKLYASNSGFVCVLDANNQVVSNPGGTEPIYEDGRVVRLRQSTPLFRHCHDVSVDSLGNIYVCEWNAGGRLPIKLERL